MRAKAFFLICFVGSSTLLFSQSANITGRIVASATRETLPFATIFINNSTIGTSADENGDFELRDVPFGMYELVVSYVGYNSIQVNIPINTEVIRLGEVELMPSEPKSNIAAAMGRRDPGWESNLKRFKKGFLGEGKLAEQCEILNPYVIQFSKGPERTLTATATEPIEISNMALGYKLSFCLTHFEANKNSDALSGQIRFSEISTKGGAMALQWMDNRDISYIGSQRHLFRAILENRIQEEGFYLYTDKMGAARSVAQSSNFLSELGNSIVLYDTANIVFVGNAPNTYKILLRGRVEAHNRGKIVDQKTYSDIPYPVSWIQVEGDTVVVNRDGSVINTQQVVTSGAMSFNNVAQMLPLDYDREKIVRIKKEPRGITASHLQENVYMHLDKPYYYPGEMMWFKAYMNYRYLDLRDSMSRTLYVELINSNRKIVKSQMVRIDDGFAYGNWIVTDTLSSGNYYLRAYTNLNKNFDSNLFFTKPIPILGRREKVVESESFNEIIDDYQVSITTNRKVYKIRDSIALEIFVKSKNGDPMKSNLSISVTDARQVVPVKEPLTILDEFLFKGEPPTHIIDEVKHPVEYGINFSGQYINKRRKPEKATISILQGNFEHLSVIETDESGMFIENGLIFYDSSDFRLEVRSAKRKYDGRVETIKRETPPLDFQFPQYDLKIVDAGKVQRLISEYEVPRGARLLSEVLIKGKSIEEEVIRPYGKPDYVVSAQEMDLSSNNLLQILQGKVPGLIIRTVSDNTGVHTEVRVARASGLTLQLSTEPLVMIDNVPMSGRAGDILQSINAYTLESVEVTTRISPAYGSAGVNGVISIFTKKGVSPNYTPPDKGLQVVKLRGYSRSDSFRFPIYENRMVNNEQIDYRSILYWNPFIVTDNSGTASASFYAADLETQYRVVVEGINENNEPVRGVHYITITGNK